jgi:uncharacterized protein (UPF0335 family)
VNVTKCRFCDSTNLRKYLDLGNQPLANNLTDTKEEALAAEKFPLAVNWCNNCTMSQLTYAVPPEKLFKNYYYRSGMSNTFKQHCQDLIKDVNPSSDKFWVDIASNDGTLLSYVNCKKLGVEPATNLCHIAERIGVESYNEFFNCRTAEDVVTKYDYADIITAQNVFAHVNDIQDFIKGIRRLLNYDGTFIVEAPWVGDMLEENQFDTVYHEHYSYISVGGMKHFCAVNGMVLSKIKYFQGLHGGTIRYFIKHAAQPVNLDDQWAISNVIFKESFLIDRVDRIQEHVETLKKNIKTFVKDQRLHGVGQAAKATVACNALDIDRDMLPIIYDTTPEKIGKYQPGTGIYIRDFKKIPLDAPENLLIFPWNFRSEIARNVDKLGWTDYNVLTLTPNLCIDKRMDLE